MMSSRMPGGPAVGRRKTGCSVFPWWPRNHLILIDVTPRGIAGKPYAQALDKAGIVGNYNSVPFDPRKPFDPSGFRLGTPSMTSRGMGPAEMKKLASWMDEVAKSQDEAVLIRIAGEVKELCKGFPAPGLAV